MTRSPQALAAAASLALVAMLQPTPVHGLTIDMVPVGNPNNAPDTRYNGISVGSVPYTFQIGKYEITSRQYTEFLNAVAKDDPNGLYNATMGDPYISGQARILRSGSAPNFSYSVAPDWAERPVNDVSFWDAARFVNWLHNGQPTGPQGPGTTEDGAYRNIGNQAAFAREPGARFFIPTENEWYKAAYHDKAAGLAAAYFDYPTGDNAIPGRDWKELSRPGNNANYFTSGYLVGTYLRTPVGEFELSSSPYGTFDQGGNVWEWTETAPTAATRGRRGGSFFSAVAYPRDGLHALSRSDVVPTSETWNIGFRVAKVAEPLPEPNSALLFSFAAAVIHRLFRRRRRTLQFAAFASIVAATLSAQASTIDTVRVGNPGNPPDPAGLGSVGYQFRMGRYEVTNAQYVEFLNSVDPAGTNALTLYNGEMSSNAFGGINFNGSAPSGAKYEIKPGRTNNPVAWVSWYDAIRFANWLHNGQGNGNTEDGAYTLLGGTPTPSNGNSITRNSGARWFLPTDDEWVKAAYHKNDGVTGNYWEYPTSTNEEPYSAPPPGDLSPDPSNTANYIRNDNIANGYNEGWAVTGSMDYDPQQNYHTNVGAYTSAKSPYGTFDQGGNVEEWTELFNEAVSYRGVRGGWAGSDRNSFDLHLNLSHVADPAVDGIGFRVATNVPEPGAETLLLLAGVALSGVRRRLRLDKWARVVRTLNQTRIRLPRSAFPAALATCVTTATVTANAADVRTIALRFEAAPGTVGPAYYYRFGAPVLNDLGQVAFWAKLSDSDYGPEGIWSEGFGALAPVAITGNRAPGAASGLEFQSFAAPCISGGLYGCRWLGSPVVINDAGHVAFPASLTFASNSNGVWKQNSGALTMSALTGTPAPGTANDFDVLPYFPESSLRLNNAGQVAFAARALRDGIWSEGLGDLSLVVQASTRTAPALNDVGQTAFALQRTIFASSPARLLDGGLYLQQADALALIVPKDSQPPGTANGVSFGHRLYGGSDSQTFGPPALNNAGRIAFRALLRGAGVDFANDDGVWSDALGTMALIAREGDQAPGAPAGVTFSVAIQSAAQVPGDTPATFGDPVLNNAGQVAFRASLGSYGSEAGIWSTDRTGALRLVARSGEHPPSMPDGAYFDYLADSRFMLGDVFPFGDPVLNDAGQIAFKARVILGGGESIWATDRNGVLQPVVSAAELLEIAPGDFRRIESIDFVGGSGNSDGRPSGFNNRGQIAFMARYVGGGEGIFVSNAVAVPEPATISLAVLLTAALSIGARDLVRPYRDAPRTTTTTPTAPTSSPGNNSSAAGRVDLRDRRSPRAFDRTPVGHWRDDSRPHS
jgi:formylglycine-generating enzyme required for sulfatase activity